MEAVEDTEWWGEQIPPPSHRVHQFKWNENEQWAQVKCTCGWEMMAGSVSELFDEYFDHRLNASLEKLLP